MKWSDKDKFSGIDVLQINLGSKEHNLRTETAQVINEYDAGQFAS